jgi:hypothetical protein
MYLILFVLLFGLIGYWLVGSRVGKSFDRALSRTGEVTQSWYEKIENWFQQRIFRRKPVDAFTAYALGKGAANFPPEFRDWLASLSAEEAQSFSHGLEGYLKGLDLDLSQLVSGGLDQDPRMRQVFVEAISVYSQAFRRAKQARLEAEAAAAASPARKPPENGKSPASAENAQRQPTPAAGAS